MIVPLSHPEPPTQSSAASSDATLRPVAIVMSPALGDTLNLLVVAHNLSHAGWHVQVFGDQAYALAAWFPHLSIAPALTQSNARDVLARFGTVI